MDSSGISWWGYFWIFLYYPLILPPRFLGGCKTRNSPLCEHVRSNAVSGKAQHHHAVGVLESLHATLLGPNLADIISARIGTFSQVDCKAETYYWACFECSYLPVDVIIIINLNKLKVNYLLGFIFLPLRLMVSGFTTGVFGSTFGVMGSCFSDRRGVFCKGKRGMSDGKRCDKVGYT